MSSLSTDPTHFPALCFCWTDVVKVGIDHDLEVVRYEPLDNFRYERGAGVRGHIFVMQKKSLSSLGSDEL